MPVRFVRLGFSVLAMFVMSSLPTVRAAAAAAAVFVSLAAAALLDNLALARFGHAAGQSR